MDRIGTQYFVRLDNQTAVTADPEQLSDYLAAGWQLDIKNSTLPAEYRSFSDVRDFTGGSERSTRLGRSGLTHRLSVFVARHTDTYGHVKWYGDWIAQCQYEKCKFRVKHCSRDIITEAANQHAIRMREGR